MLLGTHSGGKQDPSDEFCDGMEHCQEQKSLVNFQVVAQRRP